MDSSVLGHIRTLISEYGQRQQKFAVLWAAIEAGAPAGETVMRVAVSQAPEGAVPPDEPMSDDAARALVFAMGASAEAALNDLRFLEVLATTGGGDE